MNPGDCAKILGLVHHPELNGAFCEIMTEMEVNEVPEHDGVRRKRLRHGVKIFPSGETGYMPINNLEFVGGPEVTRAHCIHHFGTEDWA